MRWLESLWGTCCIYFLFSWVARYRQQHKNGKIDAISIYRFFKLLTHIFKTLHTNPIISHIKCKMPHISCKMKNIQNITNTSQKQTFANTFAIILIPVRFVCVLNREKCVAKSVLWNWNWVKGWWLVYGFADLVCGSGVWAFRNSVTSKDFLCKQCKQKTVKCKKKKKQRLQWNITRFALIILIYLDFLKATHSVWLLNAVTAGDEIIFLSLALSCLRSCLWSSSQQAQDGEHIWKQLLAETKLFPFTPAGWGLGGQVDRK